MGCYRLAVSDGTKVRIFLPSGFFRIFHQASVEMTAAIHNRTIFFSRSFESLPDVFLSVMLPIPHTVIFKILDRIQIIIPDHQETGLGGIRHRPHITAVNKLLPVTHFHLRLFFRSGSQVEVSPIDTDIISFTCQHGLLDGSCFYI